MVVEEIEEEDEDDEAAAVDEGEELPEVLEAEAIVLRTPLTAW